MRILNCLGALQLGPVTLDIVLFRGQSRIPVIFVNWLRTVLRLSASLSAPPVSSARASVLSVILRRRVREFVADLAGLIAERGLLQRCAGGSGDAPYRVDVGQLTDPLCHLLEIRERLGRPQVVRELMNTYCGAVRLAGK